MCIGVWDGTEVIVPLSSLASVCGVCIHIHLFSCVRVRPSVYRDIRPSVLLKLLLPRAHKQLKISAKGCRKRTRTIPDKRNSELIIGNKFHQGMSRKAKPNTKFLKSCRAIRQEGET